MNNRGKQIDSGSGSGDNRRTYDCNICKRGFTNPQALGGHNNIHSSRRERERYLSSNSSLPFSLPVPSQSPSSSSINFTNPNNNNNTSSHLPTIDSYHHQVSQPPINPSHNTQYFGSSSSRGGGRFSQGEFHGLNLSLGLPSVSDDDDTNQSPPKTGGSQPQDDDVDLDLRLGRHSHH